MLGVRLAGPDLIVEVADEGLKGGHEDADADAIGHLVADGRGPEFREAADCDCSGGGEGKRERGG